MTSAKNGDFQPLHPPLSQNLPFLCDCQTDSNRLPYSNQLDTPYERPLMPIAHVGYSRCYPEQSWHDSDMGSIILKYRARVTPVWSQITYRLIDLCYVAKCQFANGRGVSRRVRIPPPPRSRCGSKLLGRRRPNPSGYALANFT